MMTNNNTLLQSLVATGLELVKSPNRSMQPLSELTQVHLRTREVMHLFFVDGAEEGESKPEANEELELVRFPVPDLPSRLHELEDGKTLVGVLLYLRHRGL